jgi:hypothetical protein
MTVACGQYSAVFALDDPDVLVDAALSCPLCLGAGSSIEITLAGDAVTGRCACAACDARWSLTLAPQQLLRLALDPPRDAAVRFSERLSTQFLPPDDDEGFDD